MRSGSVLGISLILVSSAFAQLTPQQKADDFNELGGLYVKDYSFYEWKRDVIGFDLMKLQPWLDQISQTTDDLGYYELAQQYVASLKDGHDTYFNPSDFTADLRIWVDLYDGKALVDAVDTNALPTSQYNIQIGDELVSIDGKTPEDFIADYSKYNSLGTLRSTRRQNVGFVSFRPQSINPRAAIVGDSAAVVLRGSDGVLKNLTIPWVKSGTLFTSIGPVPNPNVRRTRLHPTPETRRRQLDPVRNPSKPRPSPVTSRSAPISSPAQTFYRSITKRFQYLRKPDSFDYLGSLIPVYYFALPPNFNQRLGLAGDSFFSGTFAVGSHTIGLIRIPDFQASNNSASFDDLEQAVAQFQQEIAYMKSHTDGLVVDVTSNPGGYGFYALQLLDRLTTKRYTQAGYMVRPQYSDIVSLNELLQQAADFGLEQWQIDLVTAYKNELQQAYQSERGMTGALPIDFGWSLDAADVASLSFDHPPILDSHGSPVGYDKPVVVLADDSSFSGAELFAGSFQDMQRGPVLGFTTGGLGGGREDVNTGVYSEAYTSVTVTRLLRAAPVVNPNYIAAPYIENIGILPDVPLDFQTADNLNTGGLAYVNSFTQALVALLPGK